MNTKEILKLMLPVDCVLAMLAVIGWFKSKSLEPAIIFLSAVVVTALVVYFKSLKEDQNRLDKSEQRDK
jgi:Mg2+/citrate symporter